MMKQKTVNTEIIFAIALLLCSVSGYGFTDPTTDIPKIRNIRKNP